MGFPQGDSHSRGRNGDFVDQWVCWVYRRCRGIGSSSKACRCWRPRLLHDSCIRAGPSSRPVRPTLPLSGTRALFFQDQNAPVPALPVLLPSARRPGGRLVYEGGGECLCRFHGSLRRWMLFGSIIPVFGGAGPRPCRWTGYPIFRAWVTLSGPRGRTRIPAGAGPRSGAERPGGGGRGRPPPPPSGMRRKALSLGAVAPPARMRAF